MLELGIFWGCEVKLKRIAVNWIAKCPLGQGLAAITREKREIASLTC